jgi:hypothetical protein
MGRSPDSRGELDMKRGLLFGSATISTSLAVFAAAAAASGPAAPGKDVIQLTCDGGVGPVTVSVPSSESNNGAGQVVGARGHGIGVAFTVTTTDVTTDTLLGTDSSTVGGGHAHPNQPTVMCSGVVFSAPASIFFGTDPLPPGVSATDIIEVSIAGDVIVKL